MKKLIILAALILSLSIPAISKENLIRDDLAAHLLLGTAITEHLKRKGCDPVTIFLVTAGIAVAKEIYDDNFSTEDISFAMGGILLSYSVDELTEFLLNGISLLNRDETKML